MIKELSILDLNFVTLNINIESSLVKFSKDGVKNLFIILTEITIKKRNI